MIRFDTMWQLAGSSGTEEFTGTDSVRASQANVRGICDPNQFFSGQISNLSNVDIKLGVVLHEGSNKIHLHDLRAKESLEIVNLPVAQIQVALNGTALVHGMGRIVTVENENDRNLLLQTAKLIERLNDFRYYGFPSTAHKDINSATTTTLVTPSLGKTLRFYKITLSSQGAVNDLVLETTASGGGSANIIGTINFPSAGTWVYDFGDHGWQNPNGEDGLLKLISVNATVLDVDVIYEEVDNQ